MYTYKIKNIRVIDGDTIEGTVDLGFHITMKETFRLFGINTPEVRGSEKESGLLAKQYVIDFLSKQNEYKIVVNGKDKYGRWLASIFDNTDLCLNEDLIENGYAVKYFGGIK